MEEVSECSHKPHGKFMYRVEGLPLQGCSASIIAGPIYPYPELATSDLGVNNKEFMPYWRILVDPAMCLGDDGMGFGGFFIAKHKVVEASQRHFIEPSSRAAIKECAIPPPS